MVVAGEWKILLTELCSGPLLFKENEKELKSRLVWDTFSSTYTCLSQSHYQTLVYLEEPEAMSEQVSYIG